MLPKYCLVSTLEVVDTGFSGPRPTRSWLLMLTRKSVNRMFEDDRLNCVWRRLLASSPLRVFWFDGRPVTSDWVYSKEAISENQAFPRRMGPVTPKRGYQLPRRTPCWMLKPGMKFVTLK